MRTAPTFPWKTLHDQPQRPLEGGLINETFLIGDPPRAVIQRLNTIFSPEVHHDIEAVTAHVAAKGLVTPRLIPTDDGSLWHQDDEGAAWRALTYVEGLTVHKLHDPALAAAAGALVARWHEATADLHHGFRSRRPLAHWTPHHMQVLEQALHDHPNHRLFAEVEPLAQSILGAWAAWSGPLDSPARVSHGDLKISNLRFSAAGEGLCLLDLDTMGELPLEVELGDAWRSWCNPAAEDVTDATFDLGLFAASATAYLQARPLTAEERERLPLGITRICLELSARFCADALNERYFGWNPAVAPTRGDHNLLRARGQRALAASAQAQQLEILRILGL